MAPLSWPHLVPAVSFFFLQIVPYEAYHSIFERLREIAPPPPLPQAPQAPQAPGP